jgi:hypothetical protein
LLGRDEEHLRERQCGPCNSSVDQSVSQRPKD